MPQERTFEQSQAQSMISLLLPTDWRSVLLITSCTLLVMAALVVAIRHYRYEYKLAKLLWKIDMKDVLTLRQQGSRPSLQSTKISPPVSCHQCM